MIVVLSVVVVAAQNRMDRSMSHWREKANKSWDTSFWLRRISSANRKKTGYRNDVVVVVVVVVVVMIRYDTIFV